MEKNVCLWIKSPVFWFSYAFFALFFHISRKDTPLSTQNAYIKTSYTPRKRRGYPQFLACFLYIIRLIASFYFFYENTDKLFIHNFAFLSVDNPHLSTFSVDKRGFWDFVYFYNCMISIYFDKARQYLLKSFPQAFFTCGKVINNRGKRVGFVFLGAK